MGGKKELTKRICWMSIGGPERITCRGEDCTMYDPECDECMAVQALHVYRLNHDPRLGEDLPIGPTESGLTIKDPPMRQCGRDTCKSNNGLHCTNPVVTLDEKGICDSADLDEEDIPF